jgi:hypothetical protein
MVCSLVIVSCLYFNVIIYANFVLDCCSTLLYVLNVTYYCIRDYFLVRSIGFFVRSIGFFVRECGVSTWRDILLECRGLCVEEFLCHVYVVYGNVGLFL